MWRYWTFSIFLWGSMAAVTLCQSGDDGWGSGFDVSIATSAANVSQRAVDGGGDAPVRLTEKQKRMTPPVSTASASSPPPTAPPTLLYEPRPDRCSVNFNTDPAVARRLKAQREELAYLKAIQHGNQAVMENLVQYVGAELGELSYADVIQENVGGIKEEHASCHGVVEKVVEDLEKQLLGGDVSEEALGSLHKIREESLAFEGMLRAAADIAGRLEVSSRSLHAAFTKKPKNTLGVHR